MENNLSKFHERYPVGKVIEMILQIGLAFGLIVWCFLIIKPFIMVAIWGLVIAVALHPFYAWMRNKLGNRKKLAAILVTAFVLILLLIPVFFMGKTMYEGITSLRAFLEAEHYTLPPPQDNIKDWPLIGKPLFDFWQAASTNLSDTILQFRPQITEFLKWLVTNVTNAGVGIIMFVISILIAGFFLYISDSGTKFANEISQKLAGQRGPSLVNTAGVTIRSVTKGILGVALIQSILIGLGFFAAGIPGAGLWTVLCFLLGVAQIGAFPIIIPVIIYAFLNKTTFVAIALTVWLIAIGPVDNILKPILLGRGSNLPMLVIFLGAIGGFLMSGIIGLFVGAVVLAIGYNLFMDWLKGEKEIAEKEGQVEKS